VNAKQSKILLYRKRMHIVITARGKLQGILTMEHPTDRRAPSQQMNQE